MNLPAIIRNTAAAKRAAAERNAVWLQQHMSPYFFQAMLDEQEALSWLALVIERLRSNQSVILVDREKLLVQARVNQPGSLYDALSKVGDREISYAMFS